MAPILIDSRDLLKLGFISILVVFAVFTAGFLSGYQQAEVFLTAGSETESLLLPDKVAAAERDIEPQAPEIIAAGEEVDVDHPQAKSEAAVTSEKKVAASTKAAPEKPLPVIKVPNGQLSSVSAAEIKQLPNSVQPEAAALRTNDPEDIKFSVQVGMYGSLMNAENMVKMLQAQQLDAYVSDFSNKKNEVRYNVRFGYFTDRKSARAALKNYKTRQKGDGYLVKFSDQKIIDRANVETTVRAESLEITGQKKTSGSVSTEALSPQAGDNLSQENTTQESLLTKSSVISDIQPRLPISN